MTPIEKLRSLARMIPLDCWSSAITEVADEMDWRPIETAPKDGTPIIAIKVGIHPSTGEPFTPAAVQIDGDEVRILGDSDEDACSDIFDWGLTHWMPLPPAPKGAE